jgi:hypothetical protein
MFWYSFQLLWLGPASQHHPNLDGNESNQRTKVEEFLVFNKIESIKLL